MCRCLKDLENKNSDYNIKKILSKDKNEPLLSFLLEWYFF